MSHETASRLALARALVHQEVGNETLVFARAGHLEITFLWHPPYEPPYELTLRHDYPQETGDLSRWAFRRAFLLGSFTRRQRADALVRPGLDALLRRLGWPGKFSEPAEQAPRTLEPNATLG